MGRYSTANLSGQALWKPYLQFIKGKNLGHTTQAGKSVTLMFLLWLRMCENTNIAWNLFFLRFAKGLDDFIGSVSWNGYGPTRNVNITFQHLNKCHTGMLLMYWFENTRGTSFNVPVRAWRWVLLYKCFEVQRPSCVIDETVVGSHGSELLLHFSASIKGNTVSYTAGFHHISADCFLCIAKSDEVRLVR